MPARGLSGRESVLKRGLVIAVVGLPTGHEKEIVHYSPASLNVFGVGFSATLSSAAALKW